MIHAPILNQRPDGKLSDDVCVSYQVRNGSEIVRMWIGVRPGGPVLQWDANGRDKWDGWQRRDFANGAWTLCYSHGNYGRNYACGGTWSGHNITVAGLPSKTRDIKSNLIVCTAGAETVLLEAPDGIQHDMVCQEIEPKDSWAIWFNNARDALSCRLRGKALQAAPLPIKAKNCDAQVTGHVWQQLEEVVQAHKI